MKLDKLLHLPSVKFPLLNKQPKLAVSKATQFFTILHFLSKKTAKNTKKPTPVAPQSI